MSYNIKFFLNDGDEIYYIDKDIRFDEILETIYSHIKKIKPEWKWEHGNVDDDCYGWADIGIHKNGNTYIRVQGVGDVRKGQTYFIIERN